MVACGGVSYADFLDMGDSDVSGEIGAPGVGRNESASRGRFPELSDCYDRPWRCPYPPGWVEAVDGDGDRSPAEWRCAGNSTGPSCSAAFVSSSAPSGRPGISWSDLGWPGEMGDGSRSVDSFPPSAKRRDQDTTQPRNGTGIQAEL
jgi:hypothetical protein